MTDAFVYDHVRTPRGRGKPDGALETYDELHVGSPEMPPDIPPIGRSAETSPGCPPRPGLRLPVMATE
jgi:hypothetical protein